MDFIKNGNVMGALARKIEQEGIAKGEANGEIKKARLIVIKMLKRGQPIAEISEITDLPEAEIKQLQNQVK